jgi:hypothetical protein
LRCRNNGLDRRFDLSMIDADTVERYEWHTVAVLNVVDDNLIYLGLHVVTVVRPTDNERK